MSATDTASARLPPRERRSPGRLGRSVVPSPAKRPSRPNGRWLQIAYVLIDICLISLNCLLTASARSGYFPKFATLSHIITDTGWRAVDQSTNFYLACLMLYVGITVVSCQNQHLYRTSKTSTSLDETLSVLKAVAISTLLLGAFIFLSGVKTVPRSVVACSAILNAVTLAGWRVLRRRIVRRRVLKGVGSRNALIIGAGTVGESLASYLKFNPHLGYVVKGFLDVNGNSSTLGTIEDLSRMAQSHFIDEIFVTIPQYPALVKEVILEARKKRIGVNVIPELFDGLGHRVPIRYVGDLPVMELYREPIPEISLLGKRAIDILLASSGIVLTTPLLMIIGIAIRLDSAGPIFYRAPRVGKRGRIFTCWKLRTMTLDADLQKERLRHLNERNGPFFKIADDPRITRIGKWLRRYSLDELPQLWNVIRGEMSLVGPRPHPVDDCQKYDAAHLRRLDVCPGLTGLWQVTARQDPSFEKSLDLDVEYIENWSFWMDLAILLRTIPEIIRASGT